jgi:hypothetical protein
MFKDVACMIIDLLCEGRQESVDGFWKLQGPKKAEKYSQSE